MILDGRTQWGCSLGEFYAQPTILSLLARHGITAPPLSDVAGAEHRAYAFIDTLDNLTRWLIRCPDCRSGAEYVWLDQLQMLCVNCANRSIGHRWRPVVIPANRKRIEALLMERPDPSTRAWVPGETIAQIKADNAALVEVA